MVQVSSMLTSEHRRKLLEIARRSIETHLKKSGSHSWPDDVPVDPSLEQHGAAFVTLERDGKLRGCIGYSEPLYPLHETVARCAVAAATQDYRFSPVTLEELPDLQISVSALTPLTQLKRVEDLEPGRHGLLISGEEHRGLLLPQVAAERGWDRERFLEETCRKAGLSGNAWKEGKVEIFTFEADVIDEE